MPKDEKPEKQSSKYQETYNRSTPREVWCGQVHSGIEEAIVHAERNLGMRGKAAEPYWGTMRFTDSVVVGWKVNERKRYRLDFAKDFARAHGDAGLLVEVLGDDRVVGVDVDDPQNRGVSKVCHPTEASLQWADTYWNKWTRQYKHR